jgi:small subunit ribosomal protein S1
VPLSYAYEITKFRPDGSNLDDVDSDHGPMEAAYLETIASFASTSGVSELHVREPWVSMSDDGSTGWLEERDWVSALPVGVAEFHDGVRVPIPVAVELARAMLRRPLVCWCRLEVDGRFFVHVGDDQHVYVGSQVPCDAAEGFARQQGLFPTRIEDSPWSWTPEDADERRPADDAFWAEVAALVSERGGAVLEELPVANVSRWRRLVAGDPLDTARARIGPRARLWVWPDLAPVDLVLADLPDDIGPDHYDVVWEAGPGRLSVQPLNDRVDVERAARHRGVRGALVRRRVWPFDHPLLTAVQPDPDGVLRARWGYPA